MKSYEKRDNIMKADQYRVAQAILNTDYTRACRAVYADEPYTLVQAGEIIRVPVDRVNFEDHTVTAANLKQADALLIQLGSSPKFAVE